MIWLQIAWGNYLSFSEDCLGEPIKIPNRAWSKIVLKMWRILLACLRERDWIEQRRIQLEMESEILQIRILYHVVGFRSRLLHFSWSVQDLYRNFEIRAFMDQNPFRTEPVEGNLDRGYQFPARTLNPKGNSFCSSATDRTFPFFTSQRIRASK